VQKPTTVAADRFAAGGVKVVHLSPSCAWQGGLRIFTVDLYLKVRLACSEGMSQREAAKHFNLSRDTVRKMLSFSVPPGYRRQAEIKRPKLDGFTSIIDSIQEADRAPLKQRHTAKRMLTA
jgi:hypothetical protein